MINEDCKHFDDECIVHPGFYCNYSEYILTECPEDCKHSREFKIKLLLKGMEDDTQEL